MTLIEGDQLKIVQRILGLQSTGLTGLADFDDANVTQVLSIGPEMLRRALAPIASTGWFTCVLQNDSTAGGDTRSEIDPYTPDPSASGGYPSPVPDDLDFWILGVGAALSAGDGTLFSAGQLNVVTPATAIGWAEDDGGAAVAPLLGIHQLAAWDDLDVSLPSAHQPCFLTASGQRTYWPRIRVRRGGTINFETEQTGPGVMTLNCFMACALMPASLGQDVTS